MNVYQAADNLILSPRAVSHTNHRAIAVLGFRSVSSFTSTENGILEIDKIEAVNWKKTTSML
jgi:hypothetical protein